MDAGGVSELSFRSSDSGIVGISGGSGIAHVSCGSSVSSSCRQHWSANEAQIHDPDAGHYFRCTFESRHGTNIS